MLRITLIACSLMILSACGGGGGSSNSYGAGDGAETTGSGGNGVDGRGGCHPRASARPHEEQSASPSQIIWSGQEKEVTKL